MLAFGGKKLMPGNEKIFCIFTAPASDLSVEEVNEGFVNASEMFQERSSVFAFEVAALHRTHERRSWRKVPRKLVLESNTMMKLGSGGGTRGRAMTFCLGRPSSNPG